MDFLTVHSYPVWEHRPIDQGFSFTIENYEAVKAAHPGKIIVLGEVGWPSYTEGNLHVNRTGNEENQKRYFKEMTRWAKKNQVTTYFFSAFDEPWKGTGTEGHWGFFSVDRKAKLVADDLYPELQTDEPTSPAYPPIEHDPNGLGLDIAFRESLAKRIGSGTVNFHGAGISADRTEKSSCALDGNASIKIPFNGHDWGGVYFLFDSFDAGSAKNLKMSLKVPANVTSLELKVEGPAAVSRIVNLMDYSIGRKPSDWTGFAVSIEALNGIDFSRLSVIGLWNPRDSDGAYVAGDILVDDIHLK